MNTKINLNKEWFKSNKKTIAKTTSNLSAKVFKYDSGVEAIKISNNKGYLIILPYMGQIIWDANFNNTSLVMKNMFRQPVKTQSIIETYGCFMFHSGILTNGCPSPEDSHKLHGEFACANMDKAYLNIGNDNKGEYIEVVSEYEYTMGFSAHYFAKPYVRLYDNLTLFNINIEITNLASTDMELMYMAHMNYAYKENSQFIESVDLNNKKIRQSIPAHVTPNEKWLEFITEADKNITILDTLNQPHKYNPEIVLFMKDLKVDDNGNTHMLAKHNDGNAFYAKYKADNLPYTTRWILYNPDQQVGAFCLPATCYPEGYLTEKEKGTIQILKTKESKKFALTTGYVEEKNVRIIEDIIKSLK